MKKSINQNPRHYVAFCDNGHDYFELEFTSYHRANSRQNLEDAKKQIETRYGRKPNTYDILETVLNK